MPRGPARSQRPSQSQPEPSQNQRRRRAPVEDEDEEGAYEEGAGAMDVDESADVRLYPLDRTTDPDGFWTISNRS
jgi:hypothetical protein